MHKVAAWRPRAIKYFFNLAEDPDEQVNLLGQLEAGRLRDALDQFARRMEYLREGGDIFEAPALVRSLEP